MEEKLDQFTDKLIELGDKLVAAAEPGAKAALEAALTAVYVQSFVSIIQGVVLVLLALLAVRFLPRLLKAFAKAVDEDDPATGVSCGVAMMAASLGGLFAGIGGLTVLLRASTYMGVVSPEAALAVKILNL